MAAFFRSFTKPRSVAVCVMRCYMRLDIAGATLYIIGKRLFYFFFLYMTYQYPHIPFSDARRRGVVRIPNPSRAPTRRKGG